MNQKHSARRLALDCLIRLESDDTTVTPVLDSAIRRANLSPADRGLLNELVYGVVRWRKQLDWVLKQFVNEQFQLDPQRRNILRLGVYQLLHLDRIPPHAAIYETVELAKPKRNTTRFINAVLRSVQREAANLTYPSLESDPVGHISLSQSYPTWLVERWISQRGVDWALEFCRASNGVAPTSIRVNTLKTTREALIESLKTDGASAVESSLVPEAASLVEFPSLQSLRAYRDGWFYVQDESAMLVAHLLQPKPDGKVVDIGAAPGGKTTHIAQLMENSGKILAVELSDAKIRRITENCNRLGVTNVQSRIANAAKARLEFIAEADFVLIDAPCSGFGTLRRHADIRWNKTIEQVRQLAKLQSLILSKVARYIRPGGVLVYSTCTVEPMENEEVIYQFLDEHPHFTIENAGDFLPSVPSSAITSDGFLQTFPHEHGVDGAFAARLKAK
jgi:16S rRNA (cytosine967-C5)-methyltransferase